MVPELLSDFTSPIVNKALETGARGSTSTTTNYGVIGDALFKKAQLDLNMAELQTNTEFRIAELNQQQNQFDTNYELQKLGMTMDAQQKDWERRMYEKEQQVSGTESLLGSLSGAVSGAATGFALGGLPGAVIGGAAGGLLTYGSYQSGGRRGGQQAQQTLGTVAQGAFILKGLNDERKASDGMDTLMKTGQNLLSAMNDPSLDAESRQEASNNWQTHLQDMYRFQVDEMKMNPLEASKSVQAYGQTMRNGGFESQKDAGQYEMTKNAMDFAAEVQNTDDPAKQRQLVHQFRGKQAVSYAKMTNGDELPESLFSAYLDQTEGLKKNVKLSEFKQPDMERTSVPSGGGSSPTETAQVARRSPVSTSQRISGTPDRSTMQDYAQRNVMNQQKSTIPNPGDQSRAAPEIGERGQWRPPLAMGKGVEMDDGLDIFTKPVAAEKELAKMGGDAVEALELNKGDGRENMSTAEKMEHNLELDDTEFEKNKIPLIGDKGKGESDKVKNWREGKGQEDRKMQHEVTTRFAAINEKLEGVEEGDAGALKHNLLRQVELIDSGDIHTFKDQKKALEKDISNSGVGGKLSSYIGPLGRWGKDKQWTDEKEMSHWNEMDQLAEINASRFARLSGEKGAMSESDILRFKKLNPSPAKTKLQNKLDLISQMEMLSNFNDNAAGSSNKEKSSSKGPARGSAAWMKQERAAHDFQVQLKEEDEKRKLRWYDDY